MPLGSGRSTGCTQVSRGGCKSAGWQQGGNCGWRCKLPAAWRAEGHCGTRQAETNCTRKAEFNWLWLA